jgi:RNA polymerase sigma-70 factor (ECF subfamily)
MTGLPDGPKTGSIGQDITQLLSRIEETRLVKQAQSGDKDAFDALTRRFYPILVKVAVRVVPNIDDARDVVQDALLSAYKHLGQYRWDARFSTWLVRITINQATTFSRSRKTFVSLEENCPPIVSTPAGRVQEAMTPEALCRSLELVAIIRQAIDCLPRPYKTLMRLKCQDLDSSEIAGALGLSGTVVKLRLHRARRRLRETLAARLGDWQPVSAL